MTPEPQDDDIRSTPTARAVAAEVDDVDKNSRTVIAVINTDEVDRYGTVILPGGCDLKRYQSNPVLLWCHNGTIPPVGRAVWIAKRDGKTKLKAKFQFDKDPFASILFDKYESGSMNAFSVRMDPEWEAVSPPTDEELKARPDWKTARYIIRKWRLDEVSAVVLPGNASCLKEEVSRGLVPLDDELRTLFAALGPAPEPEPPTRTQPEPEPEHLPSLAGADVLPRLTGARSYEQVHRALMARLGNPDAMQRRAEEAISRRRGVI